MDIQSLASFSYYFDTNPAGEFLSGYILLAFFVVLVFAKKIALAFGPKDKYFKKSLKKNFWQFSILGTLGIIAVISRFAFVPYFSMRVWLYLVFIISLGFIARALFRIIGGYKKRLNSVAREKAKK